jgi:diguanylate cyclase (GGDEF)-like protein
MELNSEKILVVDDDEALCQTLAEMMDVLGHNSKTARDGSQALKILEEEPFNIVISDIKLPGIDGLSLIKKIKEKSPETDIISITGYGSKYSYTDVIKNGASDFITKPFVVDEMEAKLNRIIRERNIKNELKELNKELLKLSINDDLTGLHNRRHFYTKLKEEMSRARRQRRSLFLIMFDLDNFKKYNDTYGHIEGDQLLKNVGKVILLSIRNNVDSGFRYGGDEFTIIIPEANQEQTIMISERILQSCKNINPRPINISMGLAELKDEHDVETFVACADKAMYKAKTSEKNKIVIYGEEPRHKA